MTGHVLRFRLAVAVVKHGYHVAAQLQDVSIEQAEGVTTLSATVVDAHAFRLSQQPLTLHASTSRGTWTWPIVEWLRDASGTRASGRLGLREITRHAETATGTP